MSRSDHVQKHTQIHACTQKVNLHTNTHTHTQNQSPTPCGCDPMTLLSHIVPICHREAQREGCGGHLKGRGRLDLGAKCSQWWGSAGGVLGECWVVGWVQQPRNGAEGDKECAFTLHFWVSPFAQMCRDVSAVFSRPRSPTPPPHPTLLLFPHPLSNTT